MLDLTTGLVSCGYRCDMLCAANNSRPLVKDLGDGNRLIALKSLAEVKSTMISPAMIHFMRKHCGDYDIVHIHHPDPMACLALRLSGYKGKVVLHWHSDIFRQSKLLRFYRPLQNWLLKRADHIIGTTETYIKNSPALQPYLDKCSCVPIGIDPIVLNHTRAEQIRNMYPGKKIIFSLGRMVAYKGFGFLIESAKYLSDDYIILIGGSGPMKKEFDEQVEEDGLSNKVKLLGLIKDEDVAAYYEACDIYCMSSIFKNEAFGIVQLEAMSVGRPIVSTAIKGSGVSWVNKDGESGLVVSPENSEALASAFKKIMETPGLYENLSSQSAKRFEELFRKEKMIESCIAIYSSLMSR